MSAIDATALAPTIAGVFAVISAAFTIVGQRRNARFSASIENARRTEDRKAEAERLLARFRDPLLRAAYDLQSRIYNIFKGSFLHVYLTNGADAQRAYAIHNTAFVIVQYFGWIELIRREIQFLDLGEQASTKRLNALLDDLTKLWGTDDFPPVLRVWAGDQRAAGERMIRETARGLEVIGYADFLDIADEQPPRIRSLAQLEADVMRCATHPSEARDRLTALQHALIDLLAFLDPHYVRFPEERRMKLVHQKRATPDGGAPSAHPSSKPTARP